MDILVKPKFKRYEVTLCISTILIITLVFLFSHQEIHGENYYYWFFTKVFLESGQFPVFDRSPLTVLYLAPFYVLDFPNNVLAESTLRILIIAVSLYLFVRLITNPIISSVAVLIWLPYILDAAPFGQNLALATVLIATWYRIQYSEFSFCYFYALLIVAFLFRIDFIIFIGIFALYDFGQILFRQNYLRTLSRFRLSSTIWPLLALLSLLIYFTIFQWDHPWNNAFAQPALWFPIENPKSLGQANFVLLMNNWAIESIGKLPVDYDSYFTHKELLGGHKDVANIILNNATLISSLIDKSIVDLVKGWVWMTSLPRASHFNNISIISHFSVFVFILGAAFYYCTQFKDIGNILLILVLGMLLLKAPQILGGGQSLRHYAGTVPIFIFAALAVATIINKFIDPRQRINFVFVIAMFFISSLYFLDQLLATLNGIRSFPFIVLAIFALSVLGLALLRYGPSFLRVWSIRFDVLPSILAIFIFATPHLFWGPILKNLKNDLQNGTVRISELRYPERSPKRIIANVEPLIKKCQGILTPDALFFATFTTIAIDKFYSVFELPPFGSFKTKEYAPMKKMKIDCVMIPPSLEEAGPNAFNMQRRYREYITPYANHLISLGAKIVNVKDYGKIITSKEVSKGI
jgi:hypothetical protein